MIENGSLWIDTKNSKTYLRENENWEEKDFIKELIEEKIATLQHKIADARAIIELYKNWKDGSRMQQITRKKSFEKNSKILNDLEKKLLVFKKILRGYQQLKSRNNLNH